MDNQRNFILAAVLSLAVVFFWQMLVISPRIEKERAAAEAQAQLQAETTPSNESTTAVPSSGSEGVPAPTSGQSAVPGSSGQQASTNDSAGRVEFRSEKLDGSINLKGGRIDDLNLALYRQTVDPTSPEIRLLMPVNNENAYFAEFGFSPNADAGEVPGPGTVWTQAKGGNLTPSSPIVLQYNNEKGLEFQRKIELDADYMFTVTDTVTNTSPAAVALKPYGRIARYGTPEVAGIYVLHEGLVGSVGDQGLDEYDYGDIEDEKQVTKELAESGWLGITDKYWATALIPGGSFVAHYNYYSNGRPFYQSDFLGEAITIAAGGTAETSSRLFAGAKKVDIIDAYRDNLSIPLFDKIIDWGWFYWLTKPLFGVMNWIYQLVGNFGVAILGVTVLLKILFFPLANKSYASMANMKKMQPEMTAIRERHADDRQAQQKELMALYKKEKINPAAGCWPVLIQIPVFFSLYKVIYVTIEMRHAPFFGWIHDLSAPDPTSFLNLFGLLPFETPAFLALIAVGVWPLIMGITMFIQMQMNPAPPDPTQQMIFKWMPVMFTFMLATFPAGLVIYWAWNNFLSILQQGTIMKRQGAKIELWDNLKAMLSKKKEGSN
ncbi:MAG: membrane protein insertase YidC [Rhizobiaceae bacterium]|nr:membrane protein insertase YidC [Rhizobiaceae bacterium]